MDVMFDSNRRIPRAQVFICFFLFLGGTRPYACMYAGSTHVCLTLHACVTATPVCWQ